MFDGKSIAKQALLRAEELKTEQKRKRVIRKNVSITGLCATSMIAAMLFVTPFGDLQDNNLEIDDVLVPLGGFGLSEQAAEDAKQSIKVSDIEKLVLESEPGKGEYDAELKLQLVESEGEDDVTIKFTLLVE